MTKPRFELTAGCLCLDFANTVDKRFTGNPEDNLRGYEDFAAFGQQAGALSPAEAREFEREGKRDAGEAARLFQRAANLRETIYCIFSAVAEGREVADADTKDLNAALQRVNADAFLTRVPGKTAWRVADKGSAANRLIGRIVRSAIEVLTSEDVERVKRCASATCCWLFLDRSRSHNRRWCEMRTCGSQQKARAYYRRKTAARKKKASAKPSNANLNEQGNAR